MGLLQELGRRQPQDRRIPAVDALCGCLSSQFADLGCLGGGSLEEETTVLTRTSGNVPRNTSKPLCGILAHFMDPNPRHSVHRGQQMPETAQSTYF